MVTMTRICMSFKNILVAYDSSGFSNRAFKSALGIAEPNKSKITIATVVTGLYQPSIGFSMRYTEKILEKHEKFIKKIFSKLESAANKKGIRLSLKILHDPSVSKAIVNYVNSHKFDLIVIGSHGRTGLNKLILGSVANDVAHKAKIPVMVVK
jgi:nucleotide-binding universal stress UspA family protein